MFRRKAGSEIRPRGCVILSPSVIVLYAINTRCAVCGALYHMQAYVGADRSPSGPINQPAIGAEACQIDCSLVGNNG